MVNAKIKNGNERETFTESIGVDYREAARMAKVEKAKRLAHSSFRTFFRSFPPSPNYIYGKHTLELMDVCQKATEILESGGKWFVIVNMPFRHGKSDIISRRYPCWHRIRNPDHDIILASYNYALASGMSYEVRNIFREVGPEYGLGIKRDRQSIESWGIEGGLGYMHSAGLGGTITGRGGHLIIVDDYLKNREEAESELIRNRIWESFRSDLMTRVAPSYVVIIVATRWHEDDLVGRIIDMNDPKHEKYNKEFPKFEVFKYPAQGEDEKWLFPERFDAEWYTMQRASLGSYSWASQAQQNPRPRQGNLFRVDMVTIVEEMPKNVRWVRGWDLASSYKERVKDDPDFTVGTKSGVKEGNLFIDDVQRGQWEAPERNRRIKQTAMIDKGDVVDAYFEVVAGFKDTYTMMRQILEGIVIARKYIPVGDKVARASRLEPFFEGGKVYIKKADWNAKWLSEFGSFPSGAHDDQVDSLVISTNRQIREGQNSGVLVL